MNQITPTQLWSTLGSDDDGNPPRDAGEFARREDLEPREGTGEVP